MLKKRTFILLTMLLVLTACCAGQVLAVPADDTPVQLSQPDGTTFMARLWGDERSHGYETMDGYTILQDDSSQEWFYATLDEQGQLLKTESRVGKDRAGVQAHVRPQKIGKGQRSSGLGEPASKVVSPTGTARFPVILINFSDKSTTYTKANFETLLFGTGSGGVVSGPGTLSDYFKEVSNGKLTVTGTVVGWYKASKNWAYYGANAGGTAGNDSHPAELVKEAVNAAISAGVDFSQFDNDNDGYVDNVIIIHQGGGEEVNGDSAYDIWSHSWALSDANYYEPTVNKIYTKGKYIDAYTIQPERLGDSGGMTTMGVYAHETGHAFGLPDLYDTDTYSDSEGVGKWCVMGSGSWCYTSRSGDAPSHASAWCKSAMGWATPTKINTGDGVTLNPVETNPNAIYQVRDNPNGVDWIFSSHSGTGEYFLLENRQKTNFDGGLPGAGMLIWHVDETVSSNNDANHTAHGRVLVALEQADGAKNMEYGVNRGDTGDPYPGSSSNATFNATSNPNSKLYNGSDSGVAISNIATSGSDIIINGGAVVEPPAVPTGLKVDSVGSGQVSLSWDANIQSGQKGYYLYYVPTGGTWSFQYTTNNQYTLTGLTNGTAYTFKVRAVNMNNEMSGYSSTVTATPNGSTNPPSIPTGLHTTSINSGQVSLAWNANSETDLKGYYVAYQPTGGSWAYKYFTTNWGTISGLVDGTPYTFKVKAVNTSNQMGAYSSAVTATPTANGPVPPATPTGLTAIGGNGEVALAWNANSETDLKGYYIAYQPTGGSWDYKYLTTNWGTVSGLVNGTQYTFKVKAVNTSNQMGAYSSAVTATPIANIPVPPAAPTGLIAIGGNGEVALIWNANSETDLKGYYVAYQPTGGSWAYKYLTTNWGTVSGLVNGTQYTFKVKAVNTSNQMGAYSSAVTATPAGLIPIPPAAPTGLTAAALGNGVVSLAWNANSESDIKGYYLVYMPAGGSWTYKLCSTNYATLTELVQGLEHVFKVKAFNTSYQYSAYSLPVTVTP